MTMRPSYAPCYPDTKHRVLTKRPDTRCSDQLLLDTRRSATATSDISTPCTSPRSRDTKVHRRHCSRRLPILSYQIIQHHEQQSHGRSRRSSSSSSAWWCAWWKGQWLEGQGLQPRYPATRIWWWRPGRKSRTYRADYGGPGHGSRRVRRQHQAWRVLPLELLAFWQEHMKAGS
jgi:hypothetical protein